MFCCKGWLEHSSQWFTIVLDVQVRLWGPNGASRGLQGWPCEARGQRSHSRSLEGVALVGVTQASRWGCTSNSGWLLGSSRSSTRRSTAHLCTTRSSCRKGQEYHRGCQEHNGQGAVDDDRCHLQVQEEGSAKDEWQQTTARCWSQNCLDLAKVVTPMRWNSPTNHPETTSEDGLFIGLVGHALTEHMSKHHFFFYLLLAAQVSLP